MNGRITSPSHLVSVLILLLSMFAPIGEDRSVSGATDVVIGTITRIALEIPKPVFTQARLRNAMKPPSPSMGRCTVSRRTFYSPMTQGVSACGMSSNAMISSSFTLRRGRSTR